MKTYCIFVLALCLGLSYSLKVGNIIHDVHDEDHLDLRLATPVGFLDSANTTGASGWACDPTQPGQSLRVVFVLDGNIFAGSTTASLPREPDVAAQCGHNANHGFSFQFPQVIINILNNGRSHTIGAFAVPFPTGRLVELQNSPQTVGGASPSRTPSVTPSPSRTPSVTPSPSRTPSVTPSISVSPSSSPTISPGASNPVGFLDFANSTVATGWACDPLRPNQALTVNILVDGSFIAAVTANLSREFAVGQRCGGNSNHGFVFQFPFEVIELLSDGRPHNVSAFAVPATSGSPVELSGSPKTVQVANSFSHGFLDFANTTTAGGWACNAAFPNQTLTVYVLVDNIFFAGTTNANLPREDAVGAMCGMNSLHGWTIEFSAEITAILTDGNLHLVSAFVIPFPPSTPVELTNSPLPVQQATVIVKDGQAIVQPIIL